VVPCRRPQNVWGQLGWKPGLEFRAPPPALPIVLCSTSGWKQVFSRLRKCDGGTSGCSSKNLGHSKLWKQLRVLRPWRAGAFGGQRQVDCPQRP